ncbi:MAG: alfa-L-rhamnosidase [Ruminococcaceae bacterium]|nr:alfa-L-rhamnosidase [Oscillospiraceae bacterium]
MKNTAKWITAPRDMGVAAYTCRTSFAPRKAVKKATLCASAIGNYAVYLNGARVGKGVLTPGWTSYKKRVQYQSYDLTDLLTQNNTLAIGVGQGWAVGSIGHDDTNHCFADYTSVIAWLDVTYADGERESLVTDESWDVYSSEVTFTDIYHGETVDKTAPIARIGKAVESNVKTRLIAQVGEWITEQERLAPIEILTTPKGERVIDFGQNMTGYVEVRIKAPRGSRVVLHHAEVLDSDGNFYTANYRRARNEMTYVCSGDEDVFKPTYTFEGFRYIRLEEYPFEEIDPACFTAIAVNSEMKRTGYFRCGNEKINQLYHNIIWGQKSNYLDIPTDCPQRDERLGWTGDAQVFCRTAAINFDVQKFFRKWLGDVALEQDKDGAVYGTIPDAMPKHPTRISAAWGDAACVIPWQLYLAYGDKKLLRENYPMMKKWVGYMRGVGPEEYLWLTGMHYGDWLAMDAGEDSYVGATSNDLIASAFFAYSTELVIRAGEVLGEDVSEYRTLYTNVRNRFRSYFMENGMPKEEFPYTEVLQRGKKTPVDTVRRGMTQTALVLILYFGLCEECERAALAARLVEMIRENETRMTTGFVGTPYILHVLSQNGYTDVAYELLMQERNPSWLYSVTHGATTMWEHWNSLKEDGSFWSTAMNSFNHYAYGAVFDWIFGVSVGITPVAESPAYKTVAIAPHPSKCLGYAEGSIESRNGKIGVYWYYKGDRVYYEVEIPAGVTAALKLPSGYTATLTEGSYRFAE